MALKDYDIKGADTTDQDSFRKRATFGSLCELFWTNS